MSKGKPAATAAETIRSALEGAISRIRAADPEARRGQIEGVHRLRTSTRRLRSELRTFRKLVDRRWRTRLEKELKWLAGILGDVRDLDILTRRLRTAAVCNQVATVAATGTGTEVPLSREPQPLSRFFDDLVHRREHHARAMRDALAGARYKALLADLERSAGQPQLAEAAHKPGRSALFPLVEDSWSRLKRVGSKLEPSDPDAVFHEARKRAKRARYTAELIAPALGQETEKQTARFIAQLVGLQDILGEHQDAVVAAAELERFLAANPQDPLLTRAARALIEDQQRAGEAAREAFFPAWKKIDRNKSLRWLEKVNV